jgi:hypothetical protein
MENTGGERHTSPQDIGGVSFGAIEIHQVTPG